MEIFKNILGYEGSFQVSNQGRVKSLKRVIVYKDGRNYIVKEKFLKLRKTFKGYVRVDLCKNCKCKSFKVHRLVLFAFREPSNLQCNHKNGIKTDNRLENLEYVTNLENMQHARENGLFKDEKKVNQLDPKGNFIKLFNSIMNASRELKISVGNISSCCHGRRKTAGGYKWAF